MKVNPKVPSYWTVAINLKIKKKLTIFNFINKSIIFYANIIIKKLFFDNNPYVAPKATK